MNNLMRRCLAILIVATLVCLPAKAGQHSDGEPFIVPDGLYNARFIENRNNVSIMEFSGDYNRSLVGGGSNAAARAVVAREFYQHHADQYDFLVIFSSFEFDTGDALAFYQPVANDTQGIGVELFDNSALYGSAGELQGVIDMGAISRYQLNPLSALESNPGDNYNLVLSTLAHETLHRWGAYTNSSNGKGRDDSHWNFFLDTNGSVQYGNDWKDNGDGTFTAGPASRSFYSPLDLYLMGMRAPESVPDTFVITPLSNDFDPSDLPKPGATVTGSKQVFGVQDLIAENGPRLPASVDSQKEFRYAFIYLTTNGETPGSIEISQIDQASQEFEQRFAIMTGGAGVANVYPQVSPISGVGEYDVVGDASELANDGLGVSAALSWLASQQQSNGSWVDKPATAIRDTAVVIEVLNADPEFSDELATNNALIWLNNQAAANSDSYARKAGLIDGDPDELIDLLLAQNIDGGWGLKERYASNPLDSALVLLSLKSNNGEDRLSDLISQQAIDQATASQSQSNSVIERIKLQAREQVASSFTRAEDAIFSARNIDGSWGIATHDSGSVSTTAQILLLLDKLGYHNHDSLTPSLEWLVQQRNADGGFGLYESTVHETALALTALVRYERIGQVEPVASIQYLVDQQHVSGSWQGSVYTTALVLQAARAVNLPNLSVVEFSRSSEQVISDGERIRLTAEVANDGSLQVGESVLSFYLGDPSAGGEVFSQVDLPELAPFSQLTVNVVWDSFGQSGPNNLYVVADSAKSLPERSESDNTRSILVDVLDAPSGVELELNEDELLVQPNRPNRLPTPLAVSAVLRNNGNTDADSVLVELWQDEYGPTGTLLDSQRVSVANRSSVGVNFTSTLNSAGTTEFIVVADSEQAFTELDKENNVISGSLTTEDAIDLMVDALSVTQSPSQLLIGQSAQFEFEIVNQGTVAAPNSTVRVSVVNDSGVTELQSNSFVLAPGERKKIETQWAVDFEGQSNLLIEVDPSNQVAEADESNNNVSHPLSSELAVGVNLNVNFQDFQINPSPGLEGLGATLSIKVRNSGTEPIDVAQLRFYDGDPQLERVIGSTTLVNLGSAQSQEAQVVWPAIEGSNSRFVYAVVDPDNTVNELNEDDNTAFIKLDVNSLADLAISESSIEASPVFPRVGEIFDISVTITNRGKQAAQDVSIAVYQGSSAGTDSNLLASQVVSVPGSTDASISLQHQFEDEGDNTIFVVVDPDNQILELDEDNNRATRLFQAQSADFYVSDLFLSPNDDGLKERIDYGFNLETGSAVSVVVLNEYEREVIELPLSESQASSGLVSWDGVNRFGSLVADGTYRFAVKNDAGVYLGERSFIFDTNRSPLSEAISTDFGLFDNLSCAIGENDYQVTYGPLGQYIYFSTFFEPRESAGGVIIRTGGKANTLVSRHVKFPTGIYRANLDGSGVQQLIGDVEVSGFDLVNAANDEYDAGRLKHLIVSEDGSRLLLEIGSRFRSETELWTMRIDGSDIRRIATPAVSSAREIENHSYIGTKVYFSATLDNGVRALWQVNDVVDSVPTLVYQFNEEGRSFTSGPEIVTNRQGSNSLIHGQPVSFDSVNQTNIGLYLEGKEYQLTNVDLPARASDQTIVTSHAWAPSGNIYAAADSKNGQIHLRDVSGAQRSVIDYSALQREQFSEAEWQLLHAYLVEMSELGDWSVFAVVNTIQWNPDSSEFAFYIEDALPFFYFEDGCFDDGYGTEGEGFDISCREMPAHIRPLIERYRSLEGYYVARVEGSEITKVADSLGINFRFNTRVNGPDESSRTNDHDFSISTDNLPLFRVYGEISWLFGARELLVDGNVLLDLDEPTERTRFILFDNEVEQTELGKRIIYLGRKFDNQAQVSIVPERTSDFCDFSIQERNQNVVSQDKIQFRSLLNLEADLRVRQGPRPSAVILEGTATDKNFAEYRLEYQDADNGGAWNSVMPPSDKMTIDDQFTTWVAPYIGRFYVRLTVVDKAGNQREEIKLVNNTELASITGIYVTERDFSPNGDGVLDTTGLNFKVLQNVNVIVDIYNEFDIPVRQYIESYDVIGSEQSINWDGRDNNGRVLSDGTYRLVIQEFEFFVNLDTKGPELLDQTGPLFLPIVGGRLSELCLDYLKGELIPEQRYTLLTSCNVALNSSLEAAYSDFTGIASVSIDSRLQGEESWEVLTETDIGESIFIDASFDRLSSNQFRVFATDNAGNNAELLLSDRRNQAHVIAVTEHAPTLSDNSASIRRLFGFAFRQYDDFGFAETYLARTSMTRESLSGAPTSYSYSIDHTINGLQAVAIMVRPSGSEGDFDFTPLTFSSNDGLIHAGEELSKLTGRLQIDSFSPDLISKTDGDFEVKFRLTGANDQLVFTDPFEVSINDAPDIYFLPMVDASISELGGAHAPHPLTPDSSDPSHLGFHEHVEATLPPESVRRAYIEVQSIGDELIDSQFVSRTTVGEKTDFSEQLLLPVRLAHFNLHAPQVILRNECGYQYKIWATFETFDGNSYTVSKSAQSGCVELSVEAQPVHSTMCGADPTNQISVDLTFEFVGIMQNKPRKPLAMILGTPSQDDTGIVGFEDFYSTINFPEPSRNYNFVIDTSAYAEGTRKLRAEVIFEDGTRESVIFSVPIVHTPAELEITYPKENQLVCPTRSGDMAVEEGLGLYRFFDVEGQITSRGPGLTETFNASNNPLPFKLEDNHKRQQEGLFVQSQKGVNITVGEVTSVNANELPFFPTSQGGTRVFDPLSNLTSIRGVLSTQSVAGVGDYSITHAVSNWSGAKRCATVNVLVDAAVDGFHSALVGGRQVWGADVDVRSLNQDQAVDVVYPLTPIISPANQDGLYDYFEINYGASDAVETKITLHEAIYFGPDHKLLLPPELPCPYGEDLDKSCDGGAPLIATLFEDSSFSSEQRSFTWSGKDESGVYLPDAEYILNVAVKDVCGNYDDKFYLVEVDNTPPDFELTYPQASSAVALDIPVLGRIQDLTLAENYQLSVYNPSNNEAQDILHKSSSLFALNDGRQVSVGLANFEDGSASFPGILGIWNTQGVVGERVLRLESEDVVGNKSELEWAFVVPQRSEIITSHDTVDFYVSPNNDSRLDRLAIRTSYGVNVSATIEILDVTSGSLISTVVTNQAFSSGYNTIEWDGLTDDGVVAPDGLYTVRVTAAALGQIENEEAVFELDNTPPTIEVSNLVDNNIQLQLGRQLLGNITDKNFVNFDISLVSSSLDRDNPHQIDRPFLVAESDQQGFGLLSSLPDVLFENEALYDVTFKAIDKAGNQALQEWPMLIDLYPPEIVIASPEPLAHFNLAASPVVLLGSVTDTNIERYQVSLAAANDADESTVIHQRDVETLNEIASWDLSDLDDGLYTLTVDASDRSGRTAKESIQLIVDNTPPDVEITSPELDEYLTQVKPTQGTAYDENLGRFTLSIATGRVDESGDFSELRTSNKSVQAGLLHNVSQLPDDGVYTYRLFATDIAGNTAVTYQHFNVDTVPPEPPVLESVEFDKTLDEVTITWLAVDAPDLAGYNLYRNNIKVNDELIPELSLVEQSLPEGTYRYFVKAVDLAGLESVASNELSTVIDITPPLAIIGSPADGSRVNLLVDINGTAFSEDDFKEYRLYIGLDETQLALAKTSSLPVTAGEIFQWSTLGLVDNQEYLIRLEAEDIRENIARDEVRLIVDNLAPEAPINLAATVTNDNDVSLTWEHLIPGDDLLGYLLYRNGRLVNASGVVVGDLSQYAITERLYDDLDLPDGEYEYQVSAIDTAGNISLPSNVVTEDIDLRPPHAFFVNVNDDDEFEDSLFILTDSEDIDIANIELSFRLVGEADWQPLVVDSSDPYEYVWETQDIAYGAYELRALATDTSAKIDPAPDTVRVIKKDLVIPQTLVDLDVSVVADEGTLSWPESVDNDVVGYHIYRRCDVCTTPEKLTQSGPIDALTYVDTVDESIVYYYGISAVDEADNESVMSDEVQAFYFDTYLSVDEYLTLADSVNTSVDFSKVQLRENSTFGALDVEVDEASINADSANTDPNRFVLNIAEQRPIQSNVGLSLGKNTLDAVGSLKDGKFTGRSSEALTVIKSDKPSAPANFTAVPSASEKAVDLAWTANSVAESVVAYRIFRDDVAIDQFTLIEDSTAQSSNGEDPIGILPSSPVDDYWSAFDTDVSVGQSWSTLRLVDRIELDWEAYWRRAASLSVYALIDGEYLRIQDYQVAEVDNLGNADVIELIHPIPTTSIQIRVTEWAQSSGRLTQMRIFASEPQLTATAFEDQPSDGTYSYAVLAVNKYGYESDLSDAVIDVPVGDVTPPEEVVLSVSVAGANANLDWNTVTDAVAYKIYRDGVFIADTNVNSYVDVDLANGTYLYTVTALDAATNESEPSNEAQAVINIPLLASPVDLTAQGSTERAANTLNWEHQSTIAASSFNLYRSLESGANFELLTSTTDFVYVDTQIELDVVYYYVVVAVDQFDNESTQSNEANAVSSDLTAPATPIITTPTRAGVDYRAPDELETVGGFAEPGSMVYLLQQGVFELQPVEASRATELESIGVQDFLSVSPTGQVVSMLDRAGDFYVLENDQTVVIEELDSLTGTYVNNLLWSAEGQLIVEQFGEQHLFDFTTKEITKLELGDTDRQINSLYAYSSEKNAFIASARINGGPSEIYRFDLSTFEAQLMPQGFSFVNSLDGQYFVYASNANSGGAIITSLNTETLESTSFELENARRFDVFRQGSVISGAQQYLKLRTYDENNIAQTQVFELASGNLIDTIASNQAVWVDDQTLAYTGVNAETFDYEIVQHNLVTQSSEIIATLENDGVYPILEAYSNAGVPIILDGNGFNSHYYVVKPLGWFQFDDRVLQDGENVFSVIAVDEARNQSQASLAITVLYQRAPSIDLAVELTADPVNPVVGRDVNLEVVVNNLGDLDAPASLLSVKAYDVNGTETVIYEQLIAAVGTADSLTLNLPWRPDAQGRYNIAATVDADKLIDEISEANNIRLTNIEVRATADPFVGISLDGSALGNSQFANNQTVTGVATITNPGIEFEGTAILEVVDAQSVLVEELSRESVSLAFTEELELAYSWATNLIFAGDYLVRIRLLDDVNAPVTQAEVALSVVDPINMILGVTSDALTYRSNESALLTSAMVNSSLSSVFAGGELTTEVVSTGGSMVFSQTQTIGELIPSDRLTRSATWNVGNNATGDYIVNAKLYVGDELIAQATTRIEVLADLQASVSGKLELANARFVKPADITFNYELLNTGEVNLDQTLIVLQLIDSDDIVISSVEQNVANFPVGFNAQDGSLFASRGLNVGDYQLKMLARFKNAQANEVEQLIDLQALVVIEANPPVILISSPTTNQIFNSTRLAGRYSVVDDTRVALVASGFDSAALAGQVIAPTGQYLADLTSLTDGPHSMQVRAQDSFQNSSSQRVNFVVDNTPPLIRVENVNQSQVFTSAVTPVISVVELHPASQSMTLNGNSYAAGTPISVPGIYELKINAIDRADNSATLTVNFTVDPVDPVVVEEPFILRDDEFSTRRGVWGTVRVLQNDQLPSNLDAVAEIVDQPENGQIVIADNGVYNFFPLTRFLGQDEFTYRVTLSDGRSQTAKVLVDVFPGTSCSVVNNHASSTQLPVLLPGWARTPGDQIDPPRYRIDVLDVSDSSAFVEGGSPKVTYPGCDLTYQANIIGRKTVSVRYRVVDVATDGRAYSSRIKTFTLELSRTGKTVIVPILDLLLLNEK